MLTQNPNYNVRRQSSANIAINEDAAATVSIVAGVPQAVEQGANGEFIVSRTGPVDQPLTVSYQTQARDPTSGEPGSIVIDSNAAGYGWFVDRTPLGNSEFSDIVAPSERQAIGHSPAVDRVDLLTVLMHEMGHLFGLPESATGTPHDVMAETLGFSTRRVPMPGPPDVPADLQPVSNPAAYETLDDVFRQLGEISQAESAPAVTIAQARRAAFDGQTT